MEYKIPVYKPLIEGNEIKYVNECLASGWISSRGKFVEQFEQGFSDYLGEVYSTSVSNGTVALHLALHTLGIGCGDEVIVPTLTYIASVNSIKLVGATPVLVDAEPSTWNIDCKKIEEKINIKTKAILAVHLYGAVCDMEALQNICKRHKLFLIEDVAEAFGSTLHGRFAGTFGDIATFSFFGNKTITTGEGGMLVSKYNHLIQRANFLKSQAVSREKEYWHDEIGFNYRMTNICAAIGLAQLEVAEEIIKKKRILASMYKEALNDVQVKFQDERVNTRHSYWMVSILTVDKSSRDNLRLHLKNEGIETRPLFYPVHKMPTFYNEEPMVVSESLSDRGLNLPSWPGLSEDEVEFICNCIKTSLK